MNIVDLLIGPFESSATFHSFSIIELGRAAVCDCGTHWTSFLGILLALFVFDNG